MGIRAFLAIPATGEVVNESRRVIKQLTTAGGPDVRWVNPEQVHLTLKFFVDIRQEATIDICRRVQAVVDEISAFSAEVVGVGAFPAADRPRTIWAGVGEGANDLANVAQQVESVLETLGYPRERRRFQPHLTLGRVKGRGPMTELSETIVKFPSHVFGWLTVSELNLYRSELDRSGPIYHRMATLRLGENL